MNRYTLLKCAAMAGLLFLPCGSDAHDAGPVWITPSGYRLTGEDARREIEAAADGLPEGDSGWEFVAAPRGDAPPQAAAFGAFAPAVTTLWDDQLVGRGRVGRLAYRDVEAMGGKGDRRNG